MQTRKAGVRRYADHPLVKFVRSLDGEYYLIREVAQMLGVSEPMLTYLRRSSPTPLGATHKAQYGSIMIRLYTPERIAEIAEYMKTATGHDLGNAKRGPAQMWTPTEYHRRRRDQDRLRRYRQRAVSYRQRGMEKEATRMDRMATAMDTRLEKARVRRWEKVYGVKADPKK